MPGFDRTGPMGDGPMTGGARGRCNPVTASGGYTAYSGRNQFGPGHRRIRGRRGGFGPGHGFGRGYGANYGWYPPAAGQWPAVAPADEVEALRAEADYLRRSMDAVNARIAELEKNRADE